MTLERDSFKAQFFLTNIIGPYFVATSLKWTGQEIDFISTMNRFKSKLRNAFFTSSSNLVIKLDSDVL